MKLNQKGFTLIEGLLIVIALALVGGVGFYVYDANQDNKDTTGSQAQPDETKPAENNKKYLEIKELGVKFELNDKLKDAYYAKVGDYYYVSVHDFDNDPKLAGCAADASKEELGILALVTAKVGENNDTTFDENDKWTSEDVKSAYLSKVGDTYYGFMAGNGPCFDPTGADGDDLANTISTYKKAFTDQQSTFTQL